MLKKLNSALRSPALRLALKAAIFSAAFFVFSQNRSFFWFFVSMALGLYFYLQSAFRARQNFFSFLIFLIFLFLFAGRLPFASVKLNLFAAIISGFVLFLFLGAKNFIFINRALVYNFINTFLFLLIFIVFFAAEKSSWFFIKYLASFSAFFLLFREFVILQEQNIRNRTNINLFAVSFAFLISQFMLAAGYLPIGFLNASALCLVAVLCLKDVAANHFNGSLSRTVILRNATIAILFNVLIFMASKWEL